MKNHIPKGYSAVTPYLHVTDVEGFLRFVAAAFGAVTRAVTRDDAGAVRHAEFALEGVPVECSEATPGCATGGVALHVFVADPDAAVARAIAAGATATYPVTDHPYGERSGGVRDRWNIDWYLAAVTDHEVRERA